MLKKSLLLLLSFTISKYSNSQTLTCANTCAQAGQVYTMRTASPVIGAIGQNKFWNFSTVYVSPTAPKIYAYSTASAQASYSIYPQSTMHLMAGVSAYFLVQNASGIYTASPSSAISQTDEMSLPFPFGYGSVYNDTVNSKSLFAADTVYSTTIKSITGSGTGTVVLPNGNTYTNVLQVKTVKMSSAIKNSLPFGYSYTLTTYAYYQAGIAQALAVYSQHIDTSTNDYGPQTEVLDNVFVGINKRYQTEAAIEVLPNPASSELIIRSSSAAASQITLYTSLGQKVLSSIVENNTCYIDVSTFPRGLYVLVIEKGHASITKKIVLQEK